MHLHWLLPQADIKDYPFKMNRVQVNSHLIISHVLDNKTQDLIREHHPLHLFSGADHKNSSDLTRLQVKRLVSILSGEICPHPPQDTVSLQQEEQKEFITTNIPIRDGKNLLL